MSNETDETPDKTPSWVVQPCAADIELKNLVRARFPLIYVVTWEEARVIKSLEKIAGEINLSGVQIWDTTRGILTKLENGSYTPIENGEEYKNPGEALDYIIKKVEESKAKKLIQKSARGPIFVLCDFFRFLQEDLLTPQIERKLKVLAGMLKKSSITLVITSPELQLPLTLEKVISVLDYPLPGVEQIQCLLDEARKKLTDTKKMTVENSLAIPDENIVRALLGLTLQECEDALSKAIIMTNKFDTSVLLDLKRQIIRKGQILDYVYSEEKIGDIGGLASVKKWIKTRKSSFSEKARSYPLPYPKGVFLLGIQGTGKSLCAKVIANELGVPLLKLDMGKVFAPHIGESVAPDEEIYVRDRVDHSMKRITIEEAWKTRPVADVESYTPQMTGGYWPIAEYIRHKRTKKLLDIETASGRKISVTEDHSLFILGEDGSLTEAKPSDMAIGTPIAIPLHEAHFKTNVTFDLVKIIKRAGESDKWFVRKAYSTFGNQLKGIVGSKNFHAYKASDCAIRLNKVDTCSPYASFRLQGHSGDYAIDGKWVMNESLSELMGWFLAEGSIGHSDERLSIHSTEVDEVSALCRQCSFIPKSYIDGNKATIFVHGSALGNALRLIGMKEHRMPAWAFGGTFECRAALLRGLFTGDGGISGRNIELSTAYEKMAQDILKLLGSLGIFASSYPRLDGGYRICISVPTMIKKYSHKVGFSTLKKKKALKSLVATCSNTCIKIPLVAAIANACKENRRACTHGDTAYRLHPGRKFVRRSSIGNFIDDVNGWELVFDPIKKIEVSKEQPEFVYDLSVPGNENFVAGNVLCHNSEGNIRRALKQAESIAPCVLFVDEIDMALSGSSNGQNNDSGVSSRVLMTIMDWLQERKSPVFLVACANSMRLPPAILRKGRFDERFFVDLPDEEERLAILKIHLSKRRRDPSKFDLDKAVQSTNLFSGAEIEAVIVDAMTEAFADGEREVNTEDILTQANLSYPLSRTMKEELDDLRDRAKQKMRSANEIPAGDLGDPDEIRIFNL